MAAKSDCEISKPETTLLLTENTLYTLSNCMTEWLQCTKQPERAICEAMTSIINVGSLIHWTCYRKLTTDKEKLNRAKLLRQLAEDARASDISEVCYAKQSVI